MLNDNPTKAEELQHWKEFVGNLPPACYLGIYLSDSAPILEAAMQADADICLLGSIRRQRDEATAELEKVRTAVKDRLDVLDGARRELRFALRQLSRCAVDFQDAANAARSTADAAERARLQAFKAVKAIEEKGGF